jgi:hypothetical protein
MLLNDAGFETDLQGHEVYFILSKCEMASKKERKKTFVFYIEIIFATS